MGQADDQQTHASTASGRSDCSSPGRWARRAECRGT
jgi:hypothetical protein